MEGSPNEKSSGESNEIGNSSMEKIKFKSDDEKHDESNKSNNKNEEKMDTETRRDDIISKFNIEESVTAKRLRESDEIEESSAKKTKSENCESCQVVEDNEVQKNISAKEAEEDHFLRLFTHILNVIIDVKSIKDEEICKSIATLARSLNFEDKTINFYDVDLAKFENIAAYLYGWGRLGAGLARFKILNAARNCKKLEEKLKKSNLNLISLGSGPGTDAVGFLSALSELHYPENLSITLVDKFKEWFFCSKLADVFIKEDNFGKVSELCKKTKVELFYIDTDIEMRQTPKYKNYLQDLSKADVIIICRWFTTTKMRKLAFTEHLWGGMGRDAIILLIDSFFPDNWEKFDVLYQSEKGYSLSKMAPMRFSHPERFSSTYPITVMMKRQ